MGDTWYAHATGDPVVNRQVARSADLVRWERPDDALPELPEWSVLQKGLTWAPEVARTPAGFVLYYTLRHAASGRQCIAAAVADRPEGPFRDTRPRPLVCQPRLGGSIDPHRFVDRDGTACLRWKNDGGLWLAYHAWDSAAVGDEAGGRRSMWLDRLRFEGGRPRIDGPTDGPQEAP